MELKTGFKLNRYVLEEKIGEGGMGQVWRAKHIEQDRDVAIKVLAPEKSLIANQTQRFLQETRVLESLRDQSHIVQIYDVDTVSDTVFFAMELLPSNLAVLLNEVPSEGNKTFDGSDEAVQTIKNVSEEACAKGDNKPVRLEIRDAIRIAREICAALQEAHAKNIIHRDLKPSNVLLDDQGHVKLADFGIALAVDIHSATTDEPIAMGTMGYSSPEMFQDARLADVRADIFSLGAILYRMVTGGRAVGDFEEPCKINEAVPKWFENVILRCLHADPNARYTDIDEVVDALAGWEADTPAHEGIQKKGVYWNLANHTDFQRWKLPQQLHVSGYEIKCMEDMLGFPLTGKPTKSYTRLVDQAGNSVLRVYPWRKGRVLAFVVPEGSVDKTDIEARMTRFVAVEMDHIAETATVRVCLCIPDDVTLNIEKWSSVFRDLLRAGGHLPPESYHE